LRITHPSATTNRVPRTRRSGRTPDGTPPPAVRGGECAPVRSRRPRRATLRAGPPDCAPQP
jgi:hypothetical protein